MTKLVIDLHTSVTPFLHNVPLGLLKPTSPCKEWKTLGMVYSFVLRKEVLSYDQSCPLKVLCNIPKISK